ncbi:MAG: hypothetical protein H0U27_09750, partial [Nitrosopumilus sp.]|nr:hypothetical protein [Nitrosopumilus sp.]
MTYGINNEKLFIFVVNFFFMYLIFSFLIPQNGYSEVYLKNITSKCKFDLTDQSAIDLCYERNIERLRECRSSLAFDTTSAIKKPVNSNVNFHDLNFTTTWKSKVQPLQMPQERYDNVGEPSIASNGTYVFYTGNHYAAKSMIGKSWAYVDPSYDFKGVMRPSNTTSGGDEVENLFKADQRTIYDPTNQMYIWIRLGESFDDVNFANIIRLSISNDTVKWRVFDFIPNQVFAGSDVIDA